MKYIIILIISLMLSGCFKPTINNKLGEHCRFNNSEVMISRVAVYHTSSDVINQVITQDNELILVDQDLLIGCK